MRRRPTGEGRIRSVGVHVALSLLALVATLTLDSAGASAKEPIALKGTFKLTPGTCNPVTLTVSGSYFRLIFPKGNTNTGFFFQNSSSLCFDRGVTTLSPGTQGGLSTASYQPGPPRSFTGHGDARARAIIRPVRFAATDLSLSTQPIDPQTRRSVPIPVIIDTGGKLTGRTQAVSVAWNDDFINQGSPKPSGKRPGLTLRVHGTLNARTHRFSLTWTSLIVGGPFTGFIGYWHFIGVFVPS
jgi:hypothetical protein